MIKPKTLLAAMFGTLTKQEAIAIASAECQARAWPWREPAVVSRRLCTIVVRTNADQRGGNALFIIDARTHKIVKAGYASR